MGGEELNGGPSANEPAKDLTLVHTIQLKPMIKHISQEEWSCGVSDETFASVYSEKTRPNKLMMMKMIIINITSK